ncbi:receptor-like protein kinase HSL1 [Senna tora]|uniref:non-specific serine/threonine protein kinase n=1 Tax=Senna tora TaxID=362788 RepID=A0A834TA38_9FABA|nr:receptor-like protein kinase HSL1 [Senna tora]
MISRQNSQPEQRIGTSQISKMPPRMSTFRLHFLLLLLLSVTSQVNSQTAGSEQEILLDVKRQLRDPPSLQSWNSSSSPCGWPEIRCTGGAVTEVLLPGKGINQKLPATICDLKNLTKLNLANNDIPGEFPILLYNCSNLHFLDLSLNYFVGPIPDDIDRLKILRYLDLSANNFSGDVPAAIGRISGLQTLNLYNNEFNGTFPKEIGSLSNLESLGLAYNDKFVPMAIPSEFGNLRNLSFLWMTKCNLIGEIPESFANLTSLVNLDLSLNSLTGSIPKSLFSLKSLQNLYLYHNRLSGELPSSVQAFNLVQIDLAMNNLTGLIPEDFGKLENLTVLNLYLNQLSGQIPRSLGLIKTLKYLKVFSNKLNGTLPPEIGLYSKLEVFEVADNQLSGGLPLHLCAHNALQGVIAFSNNLSGELPGSLGNCTTLRTVQLFSNNFSGEVPLSLWTSRNLSTLMLSENSFSGQLPSKLARNMSRLEIRNNKFTGGISLGILSLVNLAVFDARNNMLSGEIPRELTGLSRLNSLMLDNNQFSGALPSEIISWKSLNTLSLSRNKLSGKIPVAMGDLPGLVYLDLSENDISGEIPPQLSNLRFIFLNLSSNNFSGTIPDVFNNLAYENSFLNIPNLCAYNSNINLSRCLTNTPQYPNKSSSKFLALILALTIVVLLAIASLAFYKFRAILSQKSRRRNLSTWRLISFQRLDFTEWNLFSNLIDDNLIGSGGFGKVYRIPSNRLGEYVAVKMIRSNRNLDHKLEKEFMAEVEILGTIRHSNIVKLLCCISSENSKLLVYEYMENHSLDRWIHGKRKASATSPNNYLAVKWPTRLKIAVGAAQGLCYMHHECSPPIIHRDVKCSNILLDSEFRARIADFGLARMMAESGEPHSLSGIAGSFGYIPPEYAYSTKINEKVDVYSFGVVLLELVTGKEPYNGDEQTSLVDWAWHHYSEGKCLADAMDEEIKEACYVDEMTSVFKLGLICTSTLPSTRPSMKEILQVLRQCCPPGCHGDKKVGAEFDIAPLIGDNMYISSYKDSNMAIGESDECYL